MQRLRPLPVAVLLGAMALLTIAGSVRNLREASAPIPRSGVSALALPEGPVDLEALPGPHPSIRPRRLFAFTALAVGVILMVVYFGWPRTYILYWIASWVIGAYSMALMSRQYPDVRLARGAILLFGLMNLAGALLLLRSGWSYAGQELPRTLRWLPLPVLAWLIVGRVVVPREIVVATYFATLSIIGSITAMKFLVRLPQGRSPGSLTLGAGFAIVAGTNALVAFTVPTFTTDGVLVFRVLITNALAYGIVAVGMHLLIFEDTTRELRRSNEQLAAAQEQLRQQAITDPLTGCYNRRFLEEVAPRELERQRRYRQPLSLLFVDVNHFKAINDRLGHQAGDRVLQHVAATVRQQLRQSDYVFRWGGDEFVVLLACDVVEARRKADTLKATLGNARIDGSDVVVTISVGVTDIPTGETDIFAAVSRADQRMYQDKAGRAAAI